MIRVDAIWLATEPMDMRAGIVVGRGFGLVIKSDLWIRGGDHRHPRGSDSVEPNTRLAELTQGVVSGSADLPWR